MVKVSATRLLPFFVFLIPALLLSGCVTLNDPESSQDYSGEVIKTLSQGESLGQSFVSRRPRLNSITLWLSNDSWGSPDGSTAQVELYESVQQKESLFYQQFSVPLNGPIQFNLSPQDNLPEQDYFLLITVLQGSVKVFGQDGDSYPQGQVFSGEQPLELDMAFRTGYDYDWRALLSDIVHLFSDLWLSVPLALTLFIPGWLLLELTRLRKRFDFGEQTALSVGISLSVIALFFLWTSTLGIRISQAFVWTAFIGLACVFIWRLGVSWKTSQQEEESPDRQEGIIITFLLAVVFILAVAVRLIMVRDLAAPPWVDSVHHALITRLILNNGFLPASFEPFFHYTSPSYHTGYHSSLAMFTWLSGIDLPQAMLIFGQVLNALSIFAVYLLTTTLVKDRKAALVAALITGLATPMPTYYTSWGRYTQLAGLLIIPVGLSLFDKLIKERTARNLLLTALSFAGIALVHYRAAAFLACLVLPYYLAQIHFDREKLHSFTRDSLPATGLLGFGTLLLALPWLLPIFDEPTVSYINAGTGSTSELFVDFSWSYLTAALGKFTLYTAGLGVVLALFRRTRLALMMVTWVGLMFFLANLSALGLPGGRIVNVTSVEILLFMPISLLTGFLFAQVIQLPIRFIPERARKPYGFLWAAVGILVAGLGARQLIPIINPVTIQFRQGDREAIRWIETNLPEDEKILINPFLWGYDIYAGNDGGYWISSLAGKMTIPPPVLYGFGDATQIIEITEFSKDVIEKSNQAEELWKLMVAEGVRYVYLGVRGGPISPATLENSSRFQLLYRQGGAWLFKVLDSETVRIQP